MPSMSFGAGQSLSLDEILGPLGAIWSEVSLSARRDRAAFALLGTGSLTPIAAAGRSAEPWQETLGTVGLVSRLGAPASGVFGGPESQRGLGGRP